MTTKLPRHRVFIVAMSLLLCAFAFGWTVVQVQQQGDRMQLQDEQIDALYGALESEQDDKEEQGLDPVAPAPDEIIDDPGAEAPPPAEPSDEQVLSAVQDYFREHPVEDGKDASPAAIAAAVINYLTENPPAPGEPGPAPTGEQILSAVAVYLDANPPPAGPPGADGTDGKDAEPLSSEEIQAELAVYLAANPVEMCPTGSSAEAITVLTTGAPTDIVACVQQQEEN